MYSKKQYELHGSAISQLLFITNKTKCGRNWITDIDPNTPVCSGVPYD